MFKKLVLTLALTLSSSAFAQFNPTGCHFITNSKGRFLTDVNGSFEFRSVEFGKTLFCSVLTKDGRVALKSASTDRFLRALKKPSRGVEQSQKLSDWESFNYYYDEANRSLELESFQGTYLAVSKNEKLVQIKGRPRVIRNSITRQYQVFRRVLHRLLVIQGSFIVPPHDVIKLMASRYLNSPSNDALRLTSKYFHGLLEPHPAQKLKIRLLPKNSLNQLGLSSIKLMSLRDKIKRLSQLSKAELEELIIYNEPLTRQLLLEISEKELSNLGAILESKAELDGVNANKTYIAAFLAKNKVNIQAPLDAARIAAIRAADVFDSAALLGVEGSINVVARAVAKSDWNYAWGAANDNARNAAWDATWGTVCRDACNTARLDAWEAARQSALVVLKTALLTLNELNPTALGQKAYTLSELVVLNWWIENSAPYFERVFETTYNRLDGSLTIASAKEMIEPRLNAPGLEENPFVIQLIYFLEKTEEYMQEFATLE